MLAFSILLFAIVTFILSFLVAKVKEIDNGRVATYLTLVAWGSLAYGLYMAKLSL